MELGFITDRLVQNLQRAQTEHITAITQVLGLKTGSQFLANVEKVTQATPDERSQLVKSAEAALAQLNKESGAPATKALINQLEMQKILAQTPGVKLVALSVNAAIRNSTSSISSTPNPPITASLLTYTNQPVQAGQTLLMQINEAQQLQLLRPLTQAELNRIVALVQAQSAATAPSSHSNLGIATPTTNMQLSGALLNTVNLEELLATLKQDPSAATKSIEAIGETLRRLLPGKDNGENLLANLPKITQFIQQLPLAERTEWLSSQVQQALKTVANHIRLADQLANPKLVEMTLKNNGQGFENKLAQVVAEQPKTLTPSNPAQSNTTTPPAATATSPLLKAINSPMNVGKAMPGHVEKIVAQDLKGALLGLLHQLDTELETTKSALPGSALAVDVNKHAQTIALPQFLGLLASKQEGELSQKQLRTQLVMLMHQHTLGSIAKIQLQQVHSLNHQLSQTDQAQPMQSWQFEIPVRQGQEVQPLHIQLEQQWVEEKNEEGGEASQRVRQWSVMLSFNLPIVGHFYAQLALLGDNLSATFWAENDHTLLEARKNMSRLKSQLESEGIQVTQMQCVTGSPPKTKMSFSYSLVDVKT